MSQDTRIDMECTVCHNLNYATTKNRKNTQARLEIKKYCKHCRVQTPHKETK